jgi:hypothetical protein
MTRLFRIGPRSRYAVPVFFFNQSNHLIDAHPLLKLSTNKVFFFFCAPGHVTGAVNQEKFSTLAAGASKIGSHQPDLAREFGVCFCCRLIIRGTRTDAGRRRKNCFKHNAPCEKNGDECHNHPVGRLPTSGSSFWLSRGSFFLLFSF